MDKGGKKRERARYMERVAWKQIHQHMQTDSQWEFAA